MFEDIDELLKSLDKGSIKKLAGTYEQLNDYFDDARERLETARKAQEAAEQQKSGGIGSKFTEGLKESLNNFKKQASEESGLDMILNVDKLFKTVEQLDGQFRNYAATVGISENQLDNFRRTVERAAPTATKYGVSIEELITIQKEFANVTGEIRSFSDDDLMRAAAMKKALQLDPAQISNFAATMETLLFNFEETSEFATELLNDTNAMGVNTSKVIQEVVASLQGAGKRLSFKGGISDLKEMAIMAQKTKVTIEETQKVAQKGRRIDSAIETIAQLQLLGGEFANIDPFEFMYNARNNPKELQKTISRLTSDLAEMNEQGEVTFSSVNLDVLEKSADALGLSLEEVRKQAEASYKLKRLDSLIPSEFNEEQKMFIASMAQFGKGGKATVAIEDDAGNQVERAIQDLSKNDFNRIFRDKAEITLEDQVRVAQTSSEILKSILNQLRTGIIIAGTKAVNADIVRGGLTAGSNLSERGGKFAVDKTQDLENLLGGFFKGMTDKIGKMTGGNSSDAALGSINELKSLSKNVETNAQNNQMVADSINNVKEAINNIQQQKVEVNVQVTPTPVNFDSRQVAQLTFPHTAEILVNRKKGTN